jgi:hypothetical protein
MGFFAYPRKNPHFACPLASRFNRLSPTKQTWSFGNFRRIKLALALSVLERI